MSGGRCASAVCAECLMWTAEGFKVGCSESARLRRCSYASAARAPVRFTKRHKNDTSAGIRLSELKTSEVEPDATFRPDALTLFLLKFSCAVIAPGTCGECVLTWSESLREYADLPCPVASHRHWPTCKRLPPLHASLLSHRSRRDARDSDTPSSSSSNPRHIVLSSRLPC